MRGFHWNGRDCDDISSTTYPGRKTPTNGVDYNCNGIQGSDQNGIDYE